MIQIQDIRYLVCNSVTIQRESESSFDYDTNTARGTAQRRFFVRIIDFVYFVVAISDLVQAV